MKDGYSAFLALCVSGVGRAQHPRLRAGMGRARRRSSAATRCASTSRPPRCRTRTASKRARASSPARATPTSWYAPAPSSKSAGCRSLQTQSGNAKIQPGSRATSKAATACAARSAPRVSTARLATSIPPATRTSISTPATSSGRRRARRAHGAARSAEGRDLPATEGVPRTLAGGGPALGKAGGAAEGPAGRRHHKDLTYLIAWLGMREVGALEPKPGLPPSSAHLAQLLAQLKQGRQRGRCCARL